MGWLDLVTNLVDISGPLFGAFLKNENVARSLPQRDPPAAFEAHIELSWKAGAIQRHRVHPPSAVTSSMLAWLLRVRRNWLDDPAAGPRVVALCRQILRNLGLDDAAIGEIALADTVQVSFTPPITENGDFPWEFVLAEAVRVEPDTTGMGSLAQTLFVVRHMPRRDPLRPRDPRSPRKVLFVKAAPGRLGEIYEFDAEQHLITSSLNLPDRALILADPTAQELRTTVARNPSDIIHITGVDSVQGARLLGDKSTPEPGMFIRADDHPAVLPFPKLATILIPSAAAAARLVTLNMHNSSAGAAAVVAQGAAAAIGFYNDVDDALAEQFLASFYSEWKRLDWNLAAAFRAALLGVVQHKKARGLGIVLWSAASAFDQPAIKSVPSERADSLTELISPTSVEDGHACISVSCNPLRKLNYSLLHNDGDLYTEFAIRRRLPGIYRGIEVEVRLAAGIEEAKYSRTVSLDDSHAVEHLSPEVRLALTSRFSRSLAESMFGTISTTVRWGHHMLHNDTKRVELLPIDEWRYDAISGQWLPSFVFPRDPAVRRIIEAAQRYLMALRDESAAGFDGYQSFDPIPATASERCRAIDAQVQAIWWAVVQDFTPTYINPPPSFSIDAQRLRTPSDVIDGGRGTCIDLTLLLVACLEYIDIYPVIFLLTDHAFAGYWRSEGSYEFLTTANLAPVDTANRLPGVMDSQITNEKSWMLGNDQFETVAELVRAGHIVPIESTLLTSRGGFWDAVEQGSQNLRNRRHFHSMFDLRRARKHVTPVPIWSRVE